MSDIIRRDPRAEWIARNRLHPLHAAMQPAQHSWMGPNGVIRKNPHGIGFIGPNGIKRIDRSGAQQGGTTKRSAAVEVQLPLHQVPAPAFFICVVPDMVGGRLSSHDRDLLGLAHQLAGSDGAVLAVVFGEHKENAFSTAGVDRLLVLEGEEFSGYAPEQRVQGLRAVDNQFNPRHWLLPDSRSGGGELGRRFAAALGERPATRVWQVKDQECIGRAGAGLQDLARPVARLILAAVECAEPVSETRHEVLPVELSTAVARSLSRIEDLGAVAVDPAAIPMAEAEFIFSGGNGVKDWDLFHQTAAALGATEGASRVAVDDGFMARDRQVGASGTWVTARVYVAVGISGAIQHLQGIGACDKVVAINLDPGCDMIKRADLSVIGESAEILRALIAAVEAYRNDAKRDAA
ncbi:electron transfer flavoprotein subunit alpha/FixB family protein [Pseudomonas umsongensis]|jgi:electron transfer flavoprotein alpha subunit|uniref:Electron transfer flavoprotein subunit alpha/FixB family protein n=1 Tax=Pseudomonas umsongensis TaxID=198618 RepID=A0ABX4DUB7_9PSED|nr:electron transfer flavoprotein subunit alpha/FixB family protein [Pseudomonas umsongensis]KEX93912.1 electron transfer flavoprotein subunit alpha [Pseudomonas putida]MBT9569607.1 electron transfer flavoprotein subunit alpha/FixB family protein [Pseudomonas umsongensis]OXR31755.1 electron transfer flavoprotein subunit alpha/FixB family protein [Pseudomonas umsongensis]QFG32829.1 electron transfer flavoprotein subunit alpha/FixB family protein [Pseudomonas umsongensis]SDT72104.1 electron tran